MNFSYELFETDGVLGIRIASNSLISGEYEHLETCLDTEIRDHQAVLNRIDNVLSGKTEKDYCGEITYAEFDKDQTKIFCDIFDDDIARCTLPTWLFREIVEVWLREAKKHFKETHKTE